MIMSQKGVRDALRVIKTIRGSAAGWSPIRLIYDDVRRTVMSFNACMFSHVKRAYDYYTVAHLVAGWDTSNCSEKVCMGSFSQGLLS